MRLTLVRTISQNSAVRGAWDSAASATSRLASSKGMRQPQRSSTCQEGHNMDRAVSGVPAMCAGCSRFRLRTWRHHAVINRCPSVRRPPSPSTSFAHYTAPHARLQLQLLHAAPQLLGAGGQHAEVAQVGGEHVRQPVTVLRRKAVGQRHSEASLSAQVFGLRASAQSCTSDHVVHPSPHARTWEK